MFYTERLMLRNWDPVADKNFMLKWRNDASISRATQGPPRPWSQERVEDDIKQWASPKNGLPHFVICEIPDVKPEESLGPNDNLFVTEDGKARYPPIGCLDFFAPGKWDFTDRVCKMGILVDAKYRNSGIGTEVVEWGLRYIFSSLAMHKVEVDIYAENEPSRRLFEKHGFTLEGTRRSCFWWDGKWGDIVSMGLLEDEWRKRST